MTLDALMNKPKSDEGSLKMTHKHTQGPWEFSLIKNRSEDDTAYAGINTEDRGKIYIATTETHMMISEEEALANAKLISAAPEMHEAILASRAADEAFCIDAWERDELRRKAKELRDLALKKAGVCNGNENI